MTAAGVFSLTEAEADLVEALCAALSSPTPTLVMIAAAEDSWYPAPHPDAAERLVEHHGSRKAVLDAARALADAHALDMPGRSTDAVAADAMFVAWLAHA